MNDYSKQCVLIYDDGSNVELAIRLSKDFGRTLYFSDWKRAYSTSNELRVGYGIDGIERVEDFYSVLDEVDLFVFPTIHFGDLQWHLKDLGKRVFGSFYGDELEIKRFKTKELYKKLSVSVIPYVIKKGTGELRKYLKDKEDKYIKIEKTRGDAETTHFINYDSYDQELSELEYELGAEKFVKEFMVEDSVPDAVEIGYDGYNILGKYPTKSLCGIEVKDAGYVGKFMEYSKLPKQLTDFNETIAPTLKKCEYANFWSTELRITKKDSFPNDLTCRMPSPPGGLQLLMYTNISDIISKGADGECIDPVPNGKYGAECIIHCEWAKKNTLNLQFPEKYRDNIKMKNLCVIDGKYYIIAQNVGVAEVGSIVATGDTLDGVIEKIKKIGKEVLGAHIEIPYDSFDKAQKNLDELKKMKIDLFNE